MLQRLCAAFGLVTTVVACSAGPLSVSQGATVQIRVNTGFGVKAAPKTSSNVNHYTFKLYTSPGAVLKKTGTSANTTTAFTTVPDGTYNITAEAFSSADDSVSITTGGPQSSSNTVTVASPAVNYSAGTALAVTINLLDGTGETVGNQLTVNDGGAYAGAIGFTP